MGVGSVALAWLLREENLLATPPTMPRGPQSFDLKPKTPPLRAQAKAMISLFMHGGPSHVDLFDPKAGTDEAQRAGLRGRSQVQLRGSREQEAVRQSVEISEARPMREWMSPNCCRISRASWMT
jgi:hypothetical protein